MAAPLYKPATRVSTTEVPYLALVTQYDPDFERRKHREVEYQFAGRVFLGDPYVRGLYNRLSNIYPVGQPYGGLDQAIIDNLEPTVGNDVPGIYMGIATGGWA